ncbi:MAG TPA: toxin-antitoxin system HicB family antitoxin [Vicinamibacterales bacterium]
MARTAPRTSARRFVTDTPARFLLRLPASLHRALTAAAAREHLSLNEYCIRRLSGPDLSVGARDQIAALLAQAEKVAGPHLRGVIAHGSWVRGEARASSDIDVMVVVAPALPLTRGLYREWDHEGPTLLGRTLDAHFVHLPADASRPSGVWCELAVEGVLLSDRDGTIAAALIEVRRAIARGQLVRRTAHGQPYWTVAA